MTRVPLPSQRIGLQHRGERYYRPSGGLNPAAILFAAVAGGVVAAVLAFPYAYIVKFLPFVKLNALTTLGFGAVIGAVPGTLLKRGKVRSPSVAAGIGAVVGVVGLYAAWVVWEEAVYGDHARYTLVERARNPAVVVRAALELNEVGTWSMGHSYGGPASRGSDAVNGWFLGLIWLTEAGIVIGMSAVVTPSMIRSVPFCETCDAWCDQKAVVRSTTDVDPAALRQKLEAGDFAYVAALGPPTSADGVMEFTRHTCGTCGQMNTLTVRRKGITRDKKGRQTAKTDKVVVDKLLVTPANLAAIAATAPPMSGGSSTANNQV